MLLTADTPDTQLGRPPPPFGPRNNVAAPLSLTLIGKPDMAVTIADICQFENNNRPALDRSAKPGFGNSQTKLKTKRCVRSKSEMPRFEFSSRWSPSKGAVSFTSTESITPLVPAPPPAPEPLSIDLAKV